MTMTNPRTKQQNRLFGSACAVLLGLSLTLAPASAQPNVPSNFPVTVPATYSTFDLNFLYLNTIAAQLSVDVNVGGSIDALANLPGGFLYQDGPNRRAITGSRNGVCYAAFSDYEGVSTVSDVFPPILKSGLDFSTCGPSSCCPTTEAVRDDLFEANYSNVLLTTVRNCATLCPGGCGVVLTGFGRGGAVAQTASIALSDLNPTVVTFGAPPSSQLPCDGINTNNVYRFVNTQAVNGAITYDPVPFVDFGGANQGGRAFVFSTFFGPVRTYANGEAPVIPSSSWATTNFLQVHSPQAYLNRFLEYTSVFIFPVPDTGFLVDYPCSLQSECFSPNSCLASSKTCGFFDPNAPVSPQLPTLQPVSAPVAVPTVGVVPATPTIGVVGDDCASDNDCIDTATCEFGLCAEKLRFLGICDENSDCVSDSCRFFFFFSVCFPF